MGRLWSLLALLAAGRFIALLARMNIVPFYPELMALYAISYTGAGALFTAFFVGYAGALVPAGLAADRFRPLRQMAFGLSLLAVGGLLVVIAPSYWLALAARALEGAAVSVIYTAGLKMVAVHFGRERRGKAMGLMEVATGAGMFTAVSAFPILSRWVDYRILLLSLTLLCALALGLVLLARSAVGEADRKLGAAGPAPRQPLTGVLNRDLLFITLTSFLGLFAVNGVLGWLPTYLVDGLHYTKGEAGLMTAVVLGSQMLWVLPGGLLSDRLGRRLPVVHIGSAAMLAGFLLLMASRGGLLLFAAASLLGLGMAWGIAPLMVLTMELFGAERAGLVGAITVAVSQVGSGLAGVTLGGLLDLTGSFTAIWIVAASLAVLRLVTGSQIRERGPKPRIQLKEEIS